MQHQRARGVEAHASPREPRVVVSTRSAQRTNEQRHWAGTPGAPALSWRRQLWRVTGGTYGSRDVGRGKTIMLRCKRRGGNKVFQQECSPGAACQVSTFSYICVLVYY